MISCNTQDDKLTFLGPREQVLSVECLVSPLLEVASVLQLWLVVRGREEKPVVQGGVVVFVSQPEGELVRRHAEGVH